MIFFSGTPANGGTGHVCYLEILSLVETDGWKDFCNEVFLKWKEFEPSIHWAKEWKLLDDGVEYMKEVCFQLLCCCSNVHI